jgi:hypothetical protein
VPVPEAPAARRLGMVTDPKALEADILIPNVVLQLDEVGTAALAINARSTRPGLNLNQRTHRATRG